MKLLTSLILPLVFIALSSCTTITPSLVKHPETLSTLKPDTYSTVGYLEISHLYLDPLADEKALKKEAEKILHTKVPDTLYDLVGDTCWIRDFDITHYSYKCAGFCTELRFHIVVLKQKR